MFSCRFYQRRISSFVISSVVLDFFQTCYKRKSFLLQKEKLSFTRGKVFCYKRKSFLLQEEKFSITRGKVFSHKRKSFGCSSKTTFSSTVGDDRFPNISLIATFRYILADIFLHFFTATTLKVREG